MTAIPSEAEYNATEYKRAKAEWQQIRHDPDMDSSIEWFMSDPEGLQTLTTRIVWMLEGCYGRGQQIMAINEAIRIYNPNCNSSGFCLLNLIAVFECRTTEAQVSKVWRTLSPYGQSTVLDAIREAVDSIRTDPDRSDLLANRIAY